MNVGSRSRMLVVAPTGGEAMSRPFRGDQGLDIVGFARSLPEAAAIAADLLPDVLVLDDEVAAGDIGNELAALREASPGASIFVVTDVRGVLELAHRSGDVAGFLNRARLGLAPKPAVD